MRPIDADALKTKINTTFFSEIGQIIDDAPTVELFSAEPKKMICPNCGSKTTYLVDNVTDLLNPIYLCRNCYRLFSEKDSLTSGPIDKDKACELLIGIGRDILDAKVPLENQSNAIKNLADLAWVIGGECMSLRVEKSVWGYCWKGEKNENNQTELRDPDADI